MKNKQATQDLPIPTDELRVRILEAAGRLIDADGRGAATTRAVAAAANVQAPVIYRLFGDKHGLLDAVAEHGLAAYVAKKSALKAHPDPVQDLRNGWDMHVAFGLAHPGLFAIMNSEPHTQADSTALAAGRDVLRRRIKNIALAGRLRVSEQRALGLLQATCNGTVLTLLNQSEQLRDPGLSRAALEAVLAAITVEVAGPLESGPTSAAAALGASLNQVSVLSEGERHLLKELLERIANSD